MIVNTSDLVGYEAEKIAKATSARSEALAKAVAIWENNQFKSAKRLGGFGMLAVTLAACNSDDDDTAAADVATQLAAAQAAQAAAETAQAAAEAALASINTAAVATPVVPVVAALSVLTANVDTVVAAATGDTVSSGIVGTIQALQSLDKIDMGAGNDTLTAIISTAVNPQLSNVETLNFSGTAIRTVDLSAATGYTTIVNTGSSAVLTISNIDSGTDLSLTNNTQGAGFTVKAASFTGTADAITINLSNVTAGTTTMSTGIETFTINSIGGATNTFNSATIAPTTVNVTGNTALTYAEGLTTTTTVAAGDMTGTLTSTWDPATAYSYTGGAGVDTLTLTGTTTVVETVNLGAGADKVTFGGNLANTDILNGGDGIDTLSSTSALLSGLTSATAATDNVSNFEALTTTDPLGNNITGANVQKLGIDTYNIAGGTGTLTMAAGSMNVNLSASLAGGALTLVDTGTLTTDSVTVTNTALAADDMGDAQNVVVTGFETANIVGNSVGGATSQDFGTIGMTADTGGTTSLVITGNSPVTTGIITAASIDLTGMTGEAAGTATFTMVGAPVGAVTILGSPGDDTLVGIAAAASTITGNAGNDTLTGGTAGDTISGGAGNDIISGGTGALATTADTITGGEGNDIITVGAGTHNVDGGAGNDSVDMVATLSTGDVISGGAGTDALILNANGTAATSGQVSNFETLQVNNNNAAANMAVFGANPGFETVTTNAAVITITNATATLSQIEFDVDGTAQTTITMSRLVDGATDTIDLETSATQTVTTVSIVNEEIVTVDAADGSLTLTNFTTTDMTSLVATGDNAVAVGTSSGTKVATVDASAMTATFSGDFAASIVAMTVKAPAAFAGTITSGSGADTVTGSSGDDNLTTNNGSDIINSGTGNDVIDAGGSHDTIVGSSTGTNGITGGSGGDTMTGGTAVDTYVLSSLTSVTPSAISFASTIVAIGDSITFANGVDVITNYSTTTGAGAGATDDILNITDARSGVPTTLIGTTVSDVGATDTFMANGAWDASAKTFTISADSIGADMLFAEIIDGTNDGIAAFTGSVILQGVLFSDLNAAGFV